MSDSEAQSPLEAIAVIGMSGRFPAAGDLDTFWRNLRDGVESISVFSDQELIAAGVDPLALRSTHYVKSNAILDGFDRMDAAFFGFSPREAEIMDPQLRLFLECAWEALEDAGYDSERYSGAIGVYGGMSMSKYLFNNLASNRALMESEGPLQVRILNDKDFLASLVAYKLNLRGPSITVQTACSTSLVAVCLACQSLLNYQSDLALAGGVSINVPHQAGYFALDGLFSPDGHCRAFDAQAQGTVGGNGVGIVVLKRLEDALADDDHIHAIIKGVAINNDGAMRVSYTAPGLDGQFEVVAMAQAVAGITADTITYVETHGTGTPLGDQIEIEALARAFRANSQQTGFCAIGSVKPNIGHLDAAAGIASLIKTILALKHKQIPPSLHVTVPNPQIDFANSPFYVNTRLSEWKASATPRRAGVSSFAIGGINAHVVLEEAPEREASEPSGPWQLLVLSARTSSALEVMTARLADFLKQHSQHQLADVAYTLQVGRRAFEHRRMLVCADHADALAALERRDPKRVLTSANVTRARPVAFMFPGLGDHYADMALELYQHEPVFREHVDRCCELLAPHLGLDLRDALYPGLRHRSGSAPAPSSALPQQGIDLRRMLRPDSLADMPETALQQTFLAQPLLFVIEYALAQLWMSWGVHPQAMIGYSIGEYVAACLAGVMSLEDALLIVARRAQMIERLPRGAMLAVALSEADVRPFLGSTLSLAAINGPSVCVLAGPAQEIAALERLLTEKGVVCRWLQAAHAFHSRMMEPVASTFAELLALVELRTPTIPYISNVTGTWITAAQATDPAYWARHLCQTVRFADGVRELWQEPDRILLEVGPGQSLSAWALQHPASAEAIAPIALPSLCHAYDAQSDLAFLRTTLGKLWLAGLPVDWASCYGTERRARVPLPTYPFERQRYWIEPHRSAQSDAAEAALAPKLDIADWFFAPVWKGSTPLAPIDDAALAARRSWLVFLDPCGVGARLVERLGRAGQDVVSVRVGAQFERLDERAYALSPRTGADYQALFADLRARGALPELIVHLWGVTADPGIRPTLAFAETCQDLGFYSLLLLAQALGDQVSAGVHIAVISSNVQDVIGDERLHPAKATMLGPCKVIPQEYPHITCRSVDIIVPEAGSAQAGNLTNLLLAEILAPTSDSVIAYRGNRRWIQVFESIRRAGMAGSRTRLREEGVYLITGGLGGIGMVLAGELARTVRARLVLVGRSAFPPRKEWPRWLATHGDQDDVSRKIRALQAIEQQGAAVLIASADVADHDGMRKVLDRTYKRFGALHGVIHAAGVMPGGMMQLKTIEQAACVLAPKVQGTLVLADLLREAQLDFLVLCSSLNAIIGGFGLVDHCAANAFLDAFAHAAVAQGATFTLSINWDAWLEVGQAARAAAELGRKASRPLHNDDLIDHPLLDVRSDEGVDQTIYLTTMSTARHWVLDEHRIAGMGVLPGTAYLEMAWVAAERYIGGGPISMQKVHFSAPLMVRDGEDREVRTLIKKDSAGFSFVIASAPMHHAAPRWTEHASGRIRSVDAGEQRKHAIEAIIARCVLAELFQSPPRSAEDHTRFGPRWRGLTRRAWIGEQESLVLIELSEAFAADLEQFKLHPALMDAATGFVQGAGAGSYVPLAYEKLTINAALSRKLYSYIRRKAGDLFDQAMIACDIAIMDEQGAELVAIQDYTLRRLPDAFAFDTPAPEQPADRTEPRMGGAPDNGAAGAEIDLAYQLTDGIAPAAGAEVFGALLAGAIPLPQIAVSTRDLQRRIAQASALTGSRVREALKQARPARVRHARANIATPYAAPRSELERKLARTWAELLAIEPVGIHDNFFDSGGDSLLATRLIAQVEEVFGVDLPLRALFEAPTVAELALMIVHRQAGQVEDEALAQVLREIRNLSPEEIQALLVAETALNSEEGARE